MKAILFKQYKICIELEIEMEKYNYGQVTNISHTLVGN